MATDKSGDATEIKRGQAGNIMCGIRAPGPKYLLKTLVGYNDHCISKYRNPRYTFRGKHYLPELYRAPGPKYQLKWPKQEGYSFGLVRKVFDTSCTPGPKYALPVPRPTPITVKYKNKPRDTGCTPGPYNVELPIPGPAYFFGRRLAPLECSPTPGPRWCSVTPVKPKAPIYSMAKRLDLKDPCRSPGPKYLLEYEKPMPKYSFGIKHSECSPPFVVECDDLC